MTAATKVTRTDCLVATLGDRAPASALEIVGYEVQLPEGTVAGPHRHAYSTVARVLDGVYQFRIGDGPAKDYRAGEVFSEPAGAIVSGRAVTATTLYVVLVRQPGEPEAKPA
jgi:quercetin dioxygenase-like cupin family protein